MDSTNSTPTPTLSPTPADPFAPKELRVPKEVEEWLQTLNPGLFKNYKDIESTWNNPLTQFSVSLVGNQEFRGAVSEIANQNHACLNLAASEFLLVIVMWILRAWRLEKTQMWGKKLWIQLWMGAVFWLCSLVIVPYLVWGDPFKTVLSQFFRAAIRHFL